MITVEYYPVFITTSPLPNGKQFDTFNSHEEFVSWVKTYVCKHCLEDFKDFYGRPATTLDDWLDMGCGCEIGVEDPDNLINWYEAMI
jgi:hypothetical protein